jgi:hypothetical protein
VVVPGWSSDGDWNDGGCTSDTNPSEQCATGDSHETSLDGESLTLKTQIANPTEARSPQTG